MLMNRFELAGTGIQVKKDSMVRLNRASLNKGYVLYHVYDRILFFITNQVHSNLRQ